MPFTKHIEYGPDKLPAEVASNDGTPLKAAWTGVIMYGPLAMTGTGATTWHQATLSLDPKLDQLQPTTDKGNLFTLKLGNKIFEPDYYRNHNSTHYYRLQFAGSNGKNHTQKNKSQAIAELRSLIAIATERVEEQTRWNSLTKKVPDYAPWAPHGFQRLETTLNKAINTMRPGNLAEIEDLQPLTALLRRAGNIDESSSDTLRKAVAYGKMVVRYVSDGSGTKDMINAAVGRLRQAIE